MTSEPTEKQQACLKFVEEIAARRFLEEKIHIKQYGAETVSWIDDIDNTLTWQMIKSNLSALGVVHGSDGLLTRMVNLPPFVIVSCSNAQYLSDSDITEEEANKYAYTRKCIIYKTDEIATMENTINIYTRVKEEFVVYEDLFCRNYQFNNPEWFQDPYILK